MDARTTTAIRSYQTDANLPADGVPSSTLLANLKIGTDATASTRLSCAQIAELQGELGERGYENQGSQDGIVGPKVRTAIRTYQTDAGLPATGEATTSLLAHIQNATTDADAEELDAGLRAMHWHDCDPQPGDFGTNGSRNGRGPQFEQAMARFEGELQRRMYYVGEVDGEVDDQDARRHPRLSAPRRPARHGPAERGAGAASEHVLHPQPVGDHVAAGVGDREPARPPRSPMSARSSSFSTAHTSSDVVSERVADAR